MKGRVVSIETLPAAPAPRQQQRASIWDEALGDLKKLEKHQAYLFPLEELGAKEKQDFQRLRNSLHAWLKKNELFHKLFTTNTSQGIVVAVRPVELPKSANERKKWEKKDKGSKTAQ